MNKKINEIIIGEGEELIENWNYGFETIDSTLNNFITEAAEFKIKIDWSNIIKTIFNISLQHIKQRVIAGCCQQACTYLQIVSQDSIFRISE